MPKSVEQRLKSATLVIASLKAELREAEDIIQAHSLASQWRQSSEIARMWTLQGPTVTGRLSGSEENKSAKPRSIGKARELGTGYSQGAFVMDDPYRIEPEGTMAHAHRVLDTHALFDSLMLHRGPITHTHDDEPGIKVNDATAFNYEFLTVPDMDFSKIEARVTAAMGVPSEFIGVDMADSPGSHAEIEARVEEGNIILHNLSYGEKPTSHSYATPEEPPKPKHNEDSMYLYLIGLDPNCTYTVWMGHAVDIAATYSKNTIGGIELLHEWSSGKLGDFPSPVSYSEQTTNCVWAALTGAKHG